MDKQHIYYLSGAIDSLANVKLQIHTDDRLSLGYRVTPIVRISRPESRQSLFGLLDEYCVEVGAAYYFDKTGENSDQLTIEGPKAVARFLEPVAGGFIQQFEKVDGFLNEVIPTFEGGKPESREEFIEVVEVAEEHGAIPSRSKYTSDYFRDRWETERGNIRQA